ncbi:hypothetical protein U8P71_17295 [Rhizobium ruizarguesonis]|nr:hypothetical protein U8P71_17295 [Rhizobium ruizarguesonis]
MASKLLGLSNDNYAKWSLQATFQPQGEEGAINLGDIEALTYTPNLTEIERYSREYPEKLLSRSDVIQKDAALSFTVLSLTPFARSILFMDSSENFLEQTTSTKSVTFSKFQKSRTYSTGLRDITVTNFDDGSADPVDFVEGTHYRLLPEIGKFEWIGADALTGGTMDVSGAAITPTAGRHQFGIMANNGVRGKLECIGSNDIGTPMHIEMWDVKLTPSGEVDLQGGDDYTQVQFAGRVYADGARDARFRFGMVTDLSN